MPSLAEIEVLYPDGTAVRIGDLVDRPTILVIPRYYGCLPGCNFISLAPTDFITMPCKSPLLSGLGFLGGLSQKSYTRA